MGMKFAVLEFEIYFVEMSAYQRYPVGITNGNNDVANFRGSKVKMVNGSASIQYKF